MEAKPTGIVVLMPAGWPGRPAATAWRAVEVLSEGRLMDGMSKFTLLGVSNPVLPGCFDSISGELTAVVTLADKGSTQARVRNKMRNNDLRLGYCHASVPLQPAS